MDDTWITLSHRTPLCYLLKLYTTNNCIPMFNATTTSNVYVCNVHLIFCQLLISHRLGCVVNLLGQTWQLLWLFIICPNNHRFTNIFLILIMLDALLNFPMNAQKRAEQKEYGCELSTVSRYNMWYNNFYNNYISLLSICHEQGFIHDMFYASSHLKIVVVSVSKMTTQHVFIIHHWVIVYRNDELKFCHSWWCFFADEWHAAKWLKYHKNKVMVLFIHVISFIWYNRIVTYILINVWFV